MLGYSFSEFIKTAYSYVITRVIMPRASLLRRPLYIRGGVLASINGGKNLTTGRGCRFEFDGKNTTLYIGTNCKFGDMTHIVALNEVRMGNDVLLASKCFISDTNHGSYNGEESSSPEIPPNNRALLKGKVIIGNNVWIGENAVILAGAVIGDGCVIGANSVVSKIIPENSMVIERNRIIKQYNKKSKQWERSKKEFESTSNIR